VCAQLDLEVMPKRPRKERRPSSFHEFWSEEFCPKKTSKNEKFDV
jgi:hypothetical protein